MRTVTSRDANASGALGEVTLAVFETGTSLYGQLGESPEGTVNPTCTE